MTVRCIEQIATKHMTFRPGETYEGNEINEHFWIVDSVGIATEDFNLHFEVLEEKKEEVVITEEEAEVPLVEKEEAVVTLEAIEEEVKKETSFSKRAGWHGK